MPAFLRSAIWCRLLPALPVLLAACTLTSTDVEPALPDGRVNGAPLLAYLAHGQPVVANNDTGLGALFSGLYGQPVDATLTSDSTLTIDATDSNQPAGYPHHRLVLQIRRFRGVGSYEAASSSLSGREASYYEVYHADKSGAYLASLAEPRQLPVAGGRRQVVITTWTPGQQLVGTFELDVAAPGQPQLTTPLRSGRFDMTVQ